MEPVLSIKKVVAKNTASLFSGLSTLETQTQFMLMGVGDLFALITLIH